MKVKMRTIKLVALMMTFIMLTLFTPLTLLQTMAESIKEIDLSPKEEIKADYDTAILEDN